MWPSGAVMPRRLSPQGAGGDFGAELVDRAPQALRQRDLGAPAQPAQERVVAQLARRSVRHGGVEAQGAARADRGLNLTGLNEKKLSLYRRRQVGFVFQFYNLVPVLTVAENVTLPLMLDNLKPDKIWLDELLERLGLSDRRDSLPNQLSGGQQQRTAIARALLHRPAIVLADEPTGNLDSRNSREIISLLRDAVRHLGQTLIVITHDPAIASQADRVILIEDGYLTEQSAVRTGG